ncbi:diphthine--ammonia ligase [Acidianus sulfidivorans JP7]|uniref:Diphthine--ammonia ligase n=1 Tax=Acidianus sulfidivorans JP7 TaxID=619593 RepID=A0A2U9IM36_9CREN|nr:diphthine--ammonia ligase [Acidianus sulfidivorans]AWR97073.1 diphthine--ammonia ligase [Acidianus sulfidivorans JP7]
MRVCVLFSGGKDSTFALHWAVFKGFEVLCLITLLPKREDSWMFQYPNVNYTDYQAKVMGYNILKFDTSGEKDKELEDLYNALNYAKKLGAEGIVSGALLSDYQRLNISLICEKLGLRSYTPLWRKNQEKYLLELIEDGFEFIITSISAYGFPYDLIGKIISKKDAEKIIYYSKKYGFNPAFEGGEAETFVVNAPLFKRKLKVEGMVKRIGEENWKYIITRIH